MELKIKVCTNDSCKVIILDDTGTGENGYLPESSSVIVKNRFKYSDTVSIDVLQHNKADGPEIQLPVYTLHDDGNKSVTMPVGFDGLLRIIHLVFGVMAAASFSGVILKFSASVASTTTGTPPTIRISSI